MKRVKIKEKHRSKYNTYKTKETSKRHEYKYISKLYPQIIYN